MQGFSLNYGAAQVMSCPEGWTRPNQGPTPCPSRGLCSHLTSTLPVTAVLSGSRYLFFRVINEISAEKQTGVFLSKLKTNQVFNARGWQVLFDTCMVLSRAVMGQLVR